MAVSEAGGREGLEKLGNQEGLASEAIRRKPRAVTAQSGQ